MVLRYVDVKVDVVTFKNLSLNAADEASVFYVFYFLTHGIFQAAKLINNDTSDYVKHHVDQDHSQNSVIEESQVEYIESAIAEHVPDVRKKDAYTTAVLESARLESSLQIKGDYETLIKLCASFERKLFREEVVTNQGKVVEYQNQQQESQEQLSLSYPYCRYHILQELDSDYKRELKNEE